MIGPAVGEFYNGAFLTKTSAELTNVYDGTMTSSPGFMAINRAAISNASVQDVVSRHF